MTTRSAQGNASRNVIVYIRGSNVGSRTVSHRSIAESAMNNARTSPEIEGHHCSDSDWSKIMQLAELINFKQSSKFAYNAQRGCYLPNPETFY
ncbi:TPA: hypothetical protein ACSTL1_004110 [Serratia fonticola]